MMRRMPIALVLFSGCSGLSASSDWDTTVDFSTLKTWAWFEGGPARGKPDSLTDGRIRSAVDEELAGRGHPKTEAAKADFLVSYTATVKRQIEARPATVSVGYGWRHGYVGMGGSELSTYNEGTLILDFVDPKTKHLLWRGTVSAAVDASRTPEQKDARIRDAVAALLRRWPPGR